MTVKEIQERVKRICGTAWDYESAHTAEDKLYQDVLLAIYHGCKDPRKLAKAALETKKISFERLTA